MSEQVEDEGPETLETEATVLCPYCGELNVIGLDLGGGGRQQYVEDCQVCCQPWRVEVSWLADGGAEVMVQAEQQD